MVTWSVDRAYPSPKELFKQIPSSQGELTLQFEMRTLRQQSTSMPSRLVSIFRLSMVRLSTPVARIAKCPPCKIEKSRNVRLRQFFRLIDLFPTPTSRGLSPLPRLRPLPQIKPGPKIETLSISSPHMRLLRQ